MAFINALEALLGFSPELGPEVMARIASVGGPRGLARAGPRLLEGLLPDGGLARADHLCSVLAAVLGASPSLDRIESAADVFAHLAPSLAQQMQASVWALLLDGGGRPLGHLCIACGGPHAPDFGPRDLLVPALRSGAAALIVVHHQLHGDLQPTDGDYSTAERLSEAGLLIGIPVLDHVMIAGGCYVSFGPPPRHFLVP